MNKLLCALIATVSFSAYAATGASTGVSGAGSGGPNVSDVNAGPTTRSGTTNTGVHHNGRGNTNTYQGSNNSSTNNINNKNELE